MPKLLSFFEKPAKTAKQHNILTPSHNLQNSSTQEQGNE